MSGQQRKVYEESGHCELIDLKSNELLDSRILSASDDAGLHLSSAISKSMITSGLGGFSYCTKHGASKSSLKKIFRMEKFIVCPHETSVSSLRKRSIKRDEAFREINEDLALPEIIKCDEHPILVPNVVSDKRYNSGNDVSITICDDNCSQLKNKSFIDYTSVFPLSFFVAIIAILGSIFFTSHFGYIKIKSVALIDHQYESNEIDTIKMYSSDCDFGSKLYNNLDRYYEKEDTCEAMDMCQVKWNLSHSLFGERYTSNQIAACLDPSRAHITFSSNKNTNIDLISESFLSDSPINSESEKDLEDASKEDDGISINDIILNDAKLNQLMYKNKEEECKDYDSYLLYPSLYGFDSCETFQLDSEFVSQHFIACNSSGIIKKAIFTKNSNGDPIVCYRNKSKVICNRQENSHTVCGCDTCSENSIFNNLPKTRHKYSRKVFSFSVFGGNRDYYCGVLRQIRLSKLFFPDWSSRVYVDSSQIPKDIMSTIRYEADVVEISQLELKKYGYFWRFLIAEDDGIDIYCVRDADAVCSRREFITVDAWLQSGKTFTTFHDLSAHYDVMLAGMWCGRERIPNMKELMLKWQIRESYTEDQEFLRVAIWPLIKDDVLVFDTCEDRFKSNEIQFPVERIGCEFIGIAHQSKNSLWNMYPHLCYE